MEEEFNQESFLAIKKKRVTFSEKNEEISDDEEEE
jgi:hypothetical protein